MHKKSSMNIYLVLVGMLIIGMGLRIILSTSSHLSTILSVILIISGVGLIAASFFKKPL